MRRVLSIAFACIVLLILPLSAAAAPGSGSILVFQLKLGTPGTGAGQFDGPAFVAVDDAGDVYVTDAGNHRVQKFDDDGTFITQWGGYGSGVKQFNLPRGIAFYGGNEADPAHYVYVVDSLNNRIQKFTPSGGFLTKWGSMGQGDGEFLVPEGIAVGPSGNVYVVDAPHERIQKFTPSGGYLTQWGSDGTGPGQLSDPLGIAVDSAERVYVTDSGYPSRVHVFSSTGGLLATWTSFGAGTYSTFTPGGVGVDSTDNVYVPDRSSYNRGLKFSSAGAPLGDWSLSVAGDIGAPNGIGVAVAGTGEVYVADAANQCVKKYGRAAPVTDTVAPVTKVSGNDTRWHRRPVTLTFKATDNTGGSGVAYTEAHLEDPLVPGLWDPWAQGTTFVAQAPADHSEDGDRVLEFRSVDSAGNIEKAKRIKVRIDTTAPRVRVQPATAQTGRRAVVKFRVQDQLSPDFRAKAWIEAAKGRIVHKATSPWTPRRSSNSWSFTCRLRRGAYTVFILAGDRAGNWSEKPGSASFVVK
jgi:sugar lactone lactonase YvrE